MRCISNDSLQTSTARWVAKGAQTKVLILWLWIRVYHDTALNSATITEVVIKSRFSYTIKINSISRKHRVFQPRERQNKYSWLHAGQLMIKGFYWIWRRGTKLDLKLQTSTDLALNQVCSWSCWYFSVESSWWDKGERACKSIHTPHKFFTLVTAKMFIVYWGFMW